MVAGDTKEPSLMGTVKIKQEKLTPPATPNHNNNISSATELSVTDDLLDNILGERKPIAEPIKSSNEILADLFKVFNAAPPTLDDDESTKDSTTHKKKKHKKEKKVKKEKKRSRQNSESKASSVEPKSKKRKVKKSKKHEDNGSATETKRHKQHKKSKDTKTEKNDVIIKKEKIDELSECDTERKSNLKSHDDDKINKEKNPPMQIQVSVSKDNNGTISKRKIVIKSLVDSTVYHDTLKEVDAKTEKERETLKEREKDREKINERLREREKRKHSHRSSKSKEKDHRSSARSHSSSLSLSDEETYLREREKEQRERYKDREREKDDFYGDYRRDTDRNDRRKHRSRNDFYRHDDRRRSRSSSRHRHDRDRDSERIDKKRLLEIARKNAITMLKNGTLPGAHNLDPEAKEKALTKMRYGGKSVNELTEFCKKLSKGESSGYLSNISGGESDIDADLEKPFHHPFVIKDRGPIVMNIKNATPIPPKTAEQTKAILMQFPVSSGLHHRTNESEWVPVEPTKPAKKDKEVATPATLATTEASTAPKHKAQSVTQSINDVPLPTTDYGYQTSMFTQPTVVATQVPAPVPMPVPPPLPAPAPATKPTIVPTPAPLAIEPVPAPVITSTTFQTASDNIFASTGQICKDLDVTSIITKRLNAMRKLQENPMDSEAIKAMYRTQKDMSAWASSKFVPGQFTGSTGANILSTKELASGFQAWAKRDQLIATTPVSGGMGMHLLQKMGWKPGEGLGKEKNGSLQPLLLEVKLDKKGLVAEEESPQVQRQRAQAAKKAKATTLAQAKLNFESKHPVSLLGELSAKRKFGAPLYELVMQEGPSHQRQFLYSVQLNGQIFQPNVTSLNKKEAKANAAKFALQKMGFLPDTPCQTPQPIQAPQPVPPVQQMPSAQPYMAAPVQNPFSVNPKNYQQNISR